MTTDTHRPDTPATAGEPATTAGFRPTVAVIGGAGHLAAMRFHQSLLSALLTEAPIASDTDLPDIVHLGYGLGDATGHFDDDTTTAWVARNTATLDAARPDLVVAICNTVQPALHHLTSQCEWPVMDNIGVLADAADRLGLTHSNAEPVWLASQGAYEQRLFPHPGDTLATLAQDMILAGMNDRPDTRHLSLLDALTGVRPVVLACTDLTGYAAPLRARGLVVVDAVEELVSATLTTLPTLTSLGPNPATSQQETRR